MEGWKEGRKEGRGGREGREGREGGREGRKDEGRAEGIDSQKSSSFTNFQFISAINHLMLVLVVLSNKAECKNGGWTISSKIEVAIHF